MVQIMPKLKKGVSIAIGARTFRNEISAADVKMIEKERKSSISSLLEQEKSAVKAEAPKGKGPAKGE